MNKLIKWLWIIFSLMLLITVCVLIAQDYENMSKATIISVIIMWYCTGVLNGIQIAR